MEYDSKTCYRAVKSRDPRFDGRFFTAVVSTGIFCRPVCPAITPKQKNCQFFENAAAAMHAGFRPCLRCRPEAAPGGPAWNGVSTTVSRALRLINEGALDTSSVDDLAARLGVGERHLRRLFLEHVGVGPKAVAQTRRVLFAKKLVNETALPLTDIALAAGFGSIRRFNSTFQKIYARPPRELRRMNEDRDGSDDAGLTLKLAVRPPYDWPRLIGFLQTRAIPGVESVSDNSYRRTIAIEKQQGILEVQHAAEGDHLKVTVSLADTSNLQTVIERSRRLFDLDADSVAINAHLCRDPLLAKSIKTRPGLRIPGAWEAFEIAVRAVLGQQISVAAARTFASRLATAYGAPIKNPNGSELSHLFPTPEALAEADLSNIGLTKRRTQTLRGLSRAFADDDLGLDVSSGLEDAQARLTALPGIGPWTAQYIAMRALGEPDAFPTGDLGLLNACKALGLEMSARELDERAENWRPWRAYAAMHLWAMLPSPKRKSKP
ncbi:MAG: DNA-3-methyladenine glycosylase 2 family protein [Rhodospirillaceae bacterium]|jgi:AraC family transcriptional regulator, regulatory protein of adaptative response / DNA-3-methyladenine glycosylase II|nr:DNA-3-methyladenine glycosylase 2 family protein [Rhodospirillaceae bacterium]MBT5243692.1 DNA-3-methyladenine glycosylase 2 family protein [Rhodospirillaceae bacterium]MBT5563789.1 DNA-3-methyladenine glycosylase 2 family protein [Rhodospirillaceae bacterium]MBT6241722.1 DNA-3-methyladenine glycosylase 2 family protein [Rhodospirillaceae bacterium]MBT7137295.1 DNA-3-methyladenine glycosylase 2 family protein [Rhodospirillaceae bacterium]